MFALLRRRTQPSLLDPEPSYATADVVAVALTEATLERAKPSNDPDWAIVPVNSRRASRGAVVPWPGVTS